MSEIRLTIADEPLITVLGTSSGTLVVSDVGSQGFVLVGTAGLQGPPGPPGATSMAIELEEYRHEQVEPSTLWVIPHGLGFDPAGIVVVDNYGDFADGWDVDYTIHGAELTLSFQIPCAGTARLS